jgi:hypothetical protein
MITPILENLVIQGLATVNHKTVGQGGVFTIAVPKNQSIVITKIAIQPFINPQFKDGFGTTAGGNGTVGNIEEFIQQLISFNVSDTGVTSNNFQTGNILLEMLKRGTFQIELVSSDNNNSIFTYGTDYNFVNVYQTGANPGPRPLTMLLPAISERSTDCYSVHKNNVHIRLRFTNKYLNDIASFDDFKASFDDYTGAVAIRNLINSLPENRPNVDINSANLYFNTAVYSNTADGNKFGFYPFGVETNYNVLGQFNSNDTITFPFWTDPANVPMAGDGGEASFYSILKASAIANLRTYMNMFIPYINVEYVMINEKADGNTLVDAKRYNSVTVNK